MANVSHTQAYRFIDHVTCGAVRSLSRIIGVKNITRPFWNRWCASLIGEETIERFLMSINSIDDWPRASLAIVEQEAADLKKREATITIDEKVQQLRRLSFLAHMAQWGCMAITDEKIAAYTLSRDYYIQAEQMAHGEYYRRIAIPWEGKQCWGNLHLPKEGEGPFPLVLILHGMDDSKEEHLATELWVQEHRYAVFCIDGPGQAEPLFLENLTWPANFHEVASRAITILSLEHNCDPERVALVGMSWGGMWVIKAAANDSRIGAVFDLGGPIDAQGFRKLPYFLKTKFLQVVGVTDPEALPEREAIFSAKDPALLEKVRCPVLIVHGGRDPMVPVSDKEWLRDTLLSLHPDQDVRLKVYPTGNHCCTGQASETRVDAIDFFNRVFMAVLQKES